MLGYPPKREANVSESFEILGLQSVLIYPRDWDRSMRFWRDTLGMEVAADWSDDSHGAAALKLGSSHVIVAGPEEGRDEELGFPIEPGKLYICVKVEGLDALVTHLNSKNIPILGGPVRLHWGPRMVTVKDPEGVPVLFVEGNPDPTLVAQLSGDTAKRPGARLRDS